MSYMKNHANHVIMGDRRSLNTKRKASKRMQEGNGKRQKVALENHKSEVTDHCKM